MAGLFESIDLSKPAESGRTGNGFAGVQLVPAPQQEYPAPLFNRAVDSLSQLPEMLSGAADLPFRLQGGVQSWLPSMAMDWAIKAQAPTAEQGIADAEQFSSDIAKYVQIGRELRPQSHTADLLEEKTGEAIHRVLDPVRKGVFAGLTATAAAQNAGAMYGGADDFQVEKPEKYMTYDEFKQQLPAFGTVFDTATDLGFFKQLHKGTAKTKELLKTRRKLQENPGGITVDELNNLAEEMLRSTGRGENVGRSVSENTAVIQELQALRQGKTLLKDALAERAARNAEIIAATPSDVEAAPSDLIGKAMRERGKQIYEQMPDLPEQPPTTVQVPISQAKQGAEIARINEMQRSPATPQEVVQQNMDRAWIRNVMPNENDPNRRVVVTRPDEVARIAGQAPPVAPEQPLVQRPAYGAQAPRPTTPISESQIPVVKNLTQETKPAEVPKLTVSDAPPPEVVKTGPPVAPESGPYKGPERRKTGYEPISSEATAQMFPIGRETSELVKHLWTSDGLYESPKTGNRSFTSFKRAAETAKRIGGTVLPSEDGRNFYVAKAPLERTKYTYQLVKDSMATRLKINESSSPETTPVSVEREPVKKSGKGEESSLGERESITAEELDTAKPREAEVIAEPVEVKRTKTNSALFDLGYTAEQISGMPTKVKRSILREKVKAEDFQGLLKQSDETLKAGREASVPLDIPAAEGALRDLDVSIKKWLGGDQSVDIEAVKFRISKIADQFSPNDPRASRLIDFADDRMTAINKKQTKPLSEVSAEIDPAYTYQELIELAKQEVEAKGKKGTKEKTKTKAVPSSEFVGVDEFLERYEARRNAKARKAAPPTAEELERKATNSAYEADVLDVIDEMGNDPAAAWLREAERRRRIDMRRGGEELDVEDFGSAIRSILGNESGEWTIRGEKPKGSPINRFTPEHIAAIDKIWKVARRTGSDPLKLMKQAGASDELIAFTEKVYDSHIAPIVKAGTEPILQGPYKDRNPNDVVRQSPSRNYKGEVITRAPVMKDIATALANMTDMRFRGAPESLTTSIYAFRHMLPKELGRLYDDWRSAESRIYNRSKEITDRLKELEKGLSGRERREAFDYELVRQGEENSPMRKRADEVAKALGVKAPKAMTPEQLKYIEYGREVFNEMHKLTNEVRTSIGKNPIPYIENYVTFLRSFSMMERFAGKGVRRSNVILDELSDINHMHKSFEEARFPFTKRNVTGSFAIERDYGSVLRKYISAAIRQQEVSPIMAEIHETLKGFRTEKINPKTGKNEYFNPRGSLERTANFLSEWANHIGGVTPDTIDPRLRYVLQKLNRNMAWSTLSGNVTSALMQPASIANTISQIGSYHTIRGVSESVLPNRYKHAVKQSEILKSMVSELDLGDQKGLSIKRPLASAAEIGMTPLRVLDSQMRVATWLGAEAYGKSRGLQGRELVRFADDVVTKTQSSTLAGDVAPIQRTTKGRTLAQFQTFMINDWNFMVKEIFGAGSKDPLVAKKGDLEAGRWRKGVRYLAAAMILNELYKAGSMRAPFPDLEDAIVGGIERDESALGIAFGVGAELAEKIPFYGNIRMGKGILPPVVDTANELVIKGGKNIRKAIEEEEVPALVAEKLARLGGVAGTGQAMKYSKAQDRGEEGWDAVVGRYDRR